MVDLNNLKDDLQKGALRDICWCQTDGQLADTLTKDMSGRSLIKAIQSGIMPEYSLSVSKAHPSSRAPVRDHRSSG
jgi:hypothetical protein